MAASKTLFGATTSADMIDLEHSERRIALEYLAEAWNSAEEDGIERQSLAHASLFAALAMFVRLYGDDSTADMVADLPDRIRAGEYNLDRNLQ
ncbi:hypothetical protein [Devosia nitrariae]|uniref:Phage gp6-like head-tail connector protein n=1 Tax=Devosia nitrariae TaxID=2071872 RepID=A0ABQ5W4Z3_9HYPH|nr:hypothetical protein [Devosia nitrariae]GLQ54918.1 hypothetical protein GCM10010862_21770 [Devosia nitrariae]